MSKDNQRSKFTMLPFTQINDHIEINDETKILKKKLIINPILTTKNLSISPNNMPEKLKMMRTVFMKSVIQQDSKKGRAQSTQQQAEIIHQTLINCQIFYQQVESQLVNITLEAMRKIIADYQTNELLYKNISQNLALVNQHKKVSLRILPKQVNFLQSKLADLHKLQPEIKYIDIVEDPRLEEKDCIL